jgi:flagellar biosynthetic protein FliR
MRIDEYVLSVFLVLCRTGGCLMVVPGLSTARVPARVRMLLAVALALVIAPIASADWRRDLSSPSELLAAILAESVVGCLLGIVSRLLIEAIEFMATAIASYLGLASPEPGWEAGEPEPAIAMLISLFALMLLNAMDFSHYLIATIADSYATLPLGVLPETGSMMKFVAQTLGSACYHGLQLSAPFLVYGLVANLLFAILGKLVPQVPSYFISGPFIALGGLALLYLACGEMVVVFGEMFRTSLRHL